MEYRRFSSCATSMGALERTITEAMLPFPKSICCNGIIPFSVSLLWSLWFRLFFCPYACPDQQRFVFLSLKKNLAFVHDFLYSGTTN